jgi:hypothetical protein
MVESSSYPNQGTLHRERMRFERDFTQLPNAWLRDRRMSRGARGLLAELMTHDAGYEVSLVQLAAAGLEGRDAIRTYVSELEGRGYLHRVRERRSKGKFAGFRWVLQDPFEAVDNPASAQLAGLENPRSHRVGKPDDGQTDDGPTASVNPTTIEDQIKNINTHDPAQPQEAQGRPVDNFGSIVWASVECDARRPRGSCELGKHGRCIHCNAQPLARAAS